MAGLLIVTSLFGAALSSSITIRQGEPAAGGGVTTVTGVDLKLPATAFGGGIEAAAVNSKGDVFAADFRGGGAAASTAFAFFNQADGAGAKILDPNVNPPVTVTQNGVANPPLLAGARFLPGDQLLLAGKYMTLDPEPCCYCTDM